MDLYKYLYIEVNYSESGVVTMDISSQGDNAVMTCTIVLETTYAEIFGWCMEHDVIFNDFRNNMVYNDP